MRAYFNLFLTAEVILITSKNISAIYGKALPEVGIYKRKQELDQERDQENKQENKNSTKKATKKKRKISFFFLL